MNTGVDYSFNCHYLHFLMLALHVSDVEISVDIPSRAWLHRLGYIQVPLMLLMPHHCQGLGFENTKLLTSPRTCVSTLSDINYNYFRLSFYQTPLAFVINTASITAIAFRTFHYRLMIISPKLLFGQFTGQLL